MSESMPNLEIERPIGWFIKVPVFVILACFATFATFAAIAAWEAGSTGWGIAASLLAAFMLFALGAYSWRYLIRGVKGHYVRVRNGVLEMGEFGGRVVAAAPATEIQHITFYAEEGAGTKVETREGSFVLNRIDMHPKEFDALQAALLHLNPGIVVERV